MTPTRQPLSRRKLLRGFGTALSLPFLEAMLPRSARALTSSAPALAPTRVAWLYVPNGAHMPDWTPTREGPLRTLPWILEPLADHIDDVQVLSGLTHDKARANGDGPGDHARSAAAFLTGIQPLKTDGQVQLGISADQLLAEEVGAATRFRSLVLGCEGGRNSGQCDSGYACAYSHNISWSSETTPAGKDTSPQLVFDRLFRGGVSAESATATLEREARRQSVLDYVRADAARLERKLSSIDRRKLDEYFSGVRELERRLELVRDERGPEVADELRPAGAPASYAEHIQLFSDLLVLAFRTDSTRIASFMFANEGSNRAYPGVEVPEGHHTLSHHGGEADKLEKIRRINRFHMTGLAYFLRGLDAVRDEGRRLLDSCMIAYGSAISDGNRHNHDELPILLCGGGNGTLRPGRHTRWPRNTPANDLHLALLERMGLPLQRLGDSSGRLEGLG